MAINLKGKSFLTLMDLTPLEIRSEFAARDGVDGDPVILQNAVGDVVALVHHHLTRCDGKSRSFMHLDTVFTMVDRDKFTVHPNILSTFRRGFPGSASLCASGGGTPRCR